MDRKKLTEIIQLKNKAKNTLSNYGKLGFILVEFKELSFGHFIADLHHKVLGIDLKIEFKKEVST